MAYTKDYFYEIEDDVDEDDNDGLDDYPDSLNINEDTDETEGKFSNLSSVELVEEFRSRSISYLQNSSGFDIIPASGKVVVFDCNLQIKHAFLGLVEHDIKCGPVWSSKRSDFVGMLTVTDFIDILVDFADDKNKKNFANIERLTVQQWTDIKTKSKGKNIQSLLHISLDQSLFDGVQVLHKYNIHRLPILQKTPENTILCIINHQRLMRFLISKFWYDEDSRLLLGKLCVEDLTDTGIGTFENLITAKADTTTLEVLQLLHKNRIPAIPLVDDDGNLLDCFTRSDVRFLALDRNYDKLSTISVKDAIGNHHRHEHDRVPICRPSESLTKVFERILTNRKHACACLDEESSKFLGIFTLGDIFSFFIERPTVRKKIQGDDTDSKLRASARKTSSGLSANLNGHVGGIPNQEETILSSMQKMRIYK